MFAGASLDENSGAFCELKANFFRLILTKAEDIAIIGFDDSEHANMMVPKLTTSHVKRTRMGQEAVDKLVWRLNHKKATTSKIMIPVELILRNSTRRYENEQ